MVLILENLEKDNQNEGVLKCTGSWKARITYDV